MFSWSEPGTEAVRQFLAAEVDQPYTYAEVGSTRGWLTAASAPRVRGYHSRLHREQLGQGRPLFERAKAGLKQWRQFSLNWTVLCWPYLRIVEGEVFAVLAFHFGFWSMNAARIVYVIDEAHRFGFGYGTLPGHAYRGEERFLIEHKPDNTVWYEVASFSRPNHWLVKLGGPAAWRVQRRFGPASAEALMHAHLLSGRAALAKMHAAALSPSPSPASGRGERIGHV